MNSSLDTFIRTVKIIEAYEFKTHDYIRIRSTVKGSSRDMVLIGTIESVTTRYIEIKIDHNNFECSLKGYYDRARIKISPEYFCNRDLLKCEVDILDRESFKTIRSIESPIRERQEFKFYEFVVPRTDGSFIGRNIIVKDCDENTIVSFTMEDFNWGIVSSKYSGLYVNGLIEKGIIDIPISEVLNGNYTIYNQGESVVFKQLHKDKQKYEINIDALKGKSFDEWNELYNRW